MARICPVSFTGQVNGVYQYYSIHCTNLTPHLISSATPLAPVGCPGDDQNCIAAHRDDPSAGLGYLFKEGAEATGMNRRISDEFRFPDSPGTIDVLDWRNCVLIDSSATERLCRLFLLRVLVGSHRAFLGVGYELSPGGVTSPPQVFDDAEELGACAYLVKCDAVTFLVMLAASDEEVVAAKDNNKADAS